MVKAKNSLGCKKAYHEGKRLPGDIAYQKLPQASKDKMNWAKGQTKDSHPGLASMVETRKRQIANGEYVPRVAGVAADPLLRWKRNYIERIDSFGNSVRLESKLEAKIADILDENSVKWIRPEYLKLQSGKKYEPDFFLVDYSMYLDPKGLWCKNSKANQSDTGRKIIKAQEHQLEKIKQCREELGVHIVILYSTDKRINSWQGILDIIKEQCYM